MNNINQQIFTYFGLTFLMSWLLWSPLYLNAEASEFWVLPGAWGPTFAAVILTLKSKGKTGLKKLLGKLLIWKVPLKYYLFAIFGILGVGLVSVSIYGLMSGQWPNVNLVLNGMGLENGDLGLAFLLLPVFYLINTLVGGPIAEELGWRGYAQEILQKKYSPNLTGLIIGFMWAIWHLPLFVFLPKAIGSMPVLVYIPLMTAMGVIFSWLYNRTRGSVLLAILLHGGMNFAHGFLGANVFSDHELLTVHLVILVLLTFLLSRRNKAPAV